MKKLLITIIILFVNSVLINSCRDEITSPSETKIDGSEVNNTNLKEITQPKEAELWRPGNTYTIKWNVNSNFDKVNITLVRKYNHIRTISPSTENDGMYTWTVPTNIPYSHHYRIKLTSQSGESAPVLSMEFFILGSD